MLSKLMNVEKFGARIDELIEAFEPNTSEPRRIRNRTDVWREVALLKELDVHAQLKSWRRCMAGKVQSVFAQGVAEIYPDVPFDVISSKSFATFERYVEQALKSRARWVDATSYVTANRDKLSLLGKTYHRSVDEVPDFPLVTKHAWLLSHPQELTEDMPLPRFSAEARDEAPPRLEGLNSDYVSFLNRYVRRKRTQWNGETYRVLDIAPRSNGLDFTFGPSNYFQYINSLETIAVELADHALRNGDSLATNYLPRRGRPEAIFQFETRSAYAGINCLLLLKDYATGRASDGSVLLGDKFVLHDRPDDAIEARNTIHVVPAGGHQPISEQYGNSREVAIWHTVVREFCEELFNKQEASEMKHLGQDFLALPQVAPYVSALFRSGAARIFLLGVGLDPVTTKPEVLVAIVVNWKKATRTMELKIETNYEGKAIYVTATKEKLFEAANLFRPAKHLLPAGKSCLLLAALHYDLLMSAV